MTYYDDDAPRAAAETIIEKMRDTMNINDVYQSGGDWMGAKDLLKADGTYATARVQIERVELVSVKKNRESTEMVNKLECHFVGKDACLLLNKTNAQTIAMSHGPDTDAWIGKGIILSVKPTEMGPGISVTVMDEAQPTPPVERPTLPADAIGGFEEDIPF